VLPTAGTFRRRLDAWYRAHGRHGLPWRLTRDPYAVLVSEVMLQQTQVERVTPYYLAWLERWPTVHALAAESPAEVIRAWSGLGYNRRALNLHRAATIAADVGGLPIEPGELQALPGVGPYTAAAVASFAGEVRVAVVDTNIARVVARSRLGFASGRGQRPASLNAAAIELLPRDGPSARQHNLAMMDLGALVCTARRPACDACPVRRGCAWQAAGAPEPLVAAVKSERFEESARFARGRIIEALRGAPEVTVETLAAGLPAMHAARIETYLAALARDGLIRRSGERCALVS
jgi:A/G-specific adenine glycosylase